MELFSARESMISEILSWEGVETAPLRRMGGTEFRLGRRVFGCLSTPQRVDVLLPKSERVKLVGAGLAEPHIALPASGWISIYLHSREDEECAVQVLKTAYNIVSQDNGRRSVRHPVRPME